MFLRYPYSCHFFVFLTSYCWKYSFFYFFLRNGWFWLEKRSEPTAAWLIESLRPVLVRCTSSRCLWFISGIKFSARPTDCPVHEIKTTWLVASIDVVLVKLLCSASKLLPTASVLFIASTSTFPVSSCWNVSSLWPHWSLVLFTVSSLHIQVPFSSCLRIVLRDILSMSFCSKTSWLPK